MPGDDQLHLVRNGHGVTIDVTGQVDEETALALGHLLDCELVKGSAMTLRIADADMSMIGWAIVERAARTSARHGVRLRVEPDPGSLAPARRMARDWLDVIEEVCK